MAKKRKHIATGCLFWASLVIVLAIAAIAARDPIEKAFGKLFNGKTTVVVKPLSDKEKAVESQPSESPQKPSTSAQSFGKPSEESQPKPAVSPQTEPSKTPEEKPVVRKTRLFFASVDTSGKFVLKGVIRPIPASDSPLRDTLQSLLSGPTSQEVNMGLLSMIPPDTRLQNVAVRGDIAYIDFSESFRFNTHGREGLDTQLKQIVFAATEFPTVKKVQILIEGKKVQYLGPEGIRIDAPLGRQSFPN
jgi:germination protein M